MKEYLFLYRTDDAGMQHASVEQAQAMMNKWMDWLGSIAAQNKLSNKGERLHNSGKIIKANNTVTNGPYTDVKETIGGYSIIKAGSYEEAAELAKGCPALATGGNVEIREIDPM